MQIFFDPIFYAYTFDKQIKKKEKYSNLFKLDTFWNFQKKIKL